MVLALTAYVWQEGVGAVYGQEPVVTHGDRPGAALEQHRSDDARSTRT